MMLASLVAVATAATAAAAATVAAAAAAAAIVAALALHGEAMATNMVEKTKVVTTVIHVRLSQKGMQVSASTTRPTAHVAQPPASLLLRVLPQPSWRLLCNLKYAWLLYS